LSIYLIGIALGLVSAMVFKRTVYKGKSTPFVMELPTYRVPTARGILWHVWDKTCHYFRKAGTIILLASVLVWAITTFPRTVADPAQAGTANQAEMQMENSIAGHIGKVIEPVLRPIGFDWKVGIAVITGFAAKEVVVSTLGVLYKVEGNDAATNAGQSLGDALKNDKNFSPLIAYILMLFTLINVPCFAALAAIRAEIGWKWLSFSAAYNFVLAWVICFIAYQAGSYFGL